MQIYIAQNGQQTGPFSPEQVQQMISAGQISGNDLGWCEGMAGWAVLSGIAPAGLPIPPRLVGNPEEVRKQYLNHEASLKSIGMLYYIGGVMCLISTPVPFFSKDQPLAMSIGTAAFTVLFAFILFWMGDGIRKLNPRVRTPATIVAAIGLLGIPIGTLINAYILYLLHSDKGKMVFSEEYKAVIAATPHIKYKTSIIVWIFLVLLLGLAILAICVASFGR